MANLDPAGVGLEEQVEMDHVLNGARTATNLPLPEIAQVNDQAVANAQANGHVAAQFMPLPEDGNMVEASPANIENQVMHVGAVTLNNPDADPVFMQKH